MPPKKRAVTGSSKIVKRLKTNKNENEETNTTNQPVKDEPITKQNIVAKLKEADKNTNKHKIYKPDKEMPSSTLYTVYGDFDCTLNQTNIGNNNNKFYIIQVVEHNRNYYCWNRWGRVGEIGQNNGLEGPYNNVNDAIKSFEKKFNDKTKNDWKNRENFVPRPGKYTLIEMDFNDEEIQIVTTDDASKIKDTKPSKLDKETQELISLIFDQDMFKGALKKFDIDVKKMPLGKLSKTQIAKGFEVLEEIENQIRKSKPNSVAINELSSKFYTLIPQDVGRQRPPPINDEETLQKKYDMLTVLI